MARARLFYHHFKVAQLINAREVPFGKERRSLLVRVIRTNQSTMTKGERENVQIELHSLSLKSLKSFSSTTILLSTQFLLYRHTFISTISSNTSR